MSDDYEAPPGQIWVCGACGKRAHHRGHGGISSGWDSSCFIWAVLCWEASIILSETGEVYSADAAIEELQ